MANVNIPIKQLFDKENNNEYFYPITKTEAVKDDNGYTVEQRLTSIITAAQWAQLQQIFS